MKRARVLLADDHKILADGLRSLLEPDFEIVATVHDGRALVAAAGRLRPDVIITDISMPLLNGIEAAALLQKAGTKAKIIFLTMHSDMTYAARALEAGASGFVVKHAAPSELVSAIREVLNGRTYLSSELADDRDGPSGNGRKRSGRLTPRRREVLQLLAEGHSAKQAAGLLGVSPRTVEFHKYGMMQELGIETNAGLIQYAIKHGVVSI